MSRRTACVNRAEISFLPSHVGDIHFTRGRKREGEEKTLEKEERVWTVAVEKNEKKKRCLREIDIRTGSVAL